MNTISSRAGFTTLLLFLTVLTPASHARTLKVAVVQTVIEATLPANETKLLHFIGEAGRAGCRMVIFPENALYWPEVSTHEPTTSELDAAIEKIGQRARADGIHVVFGTAYRSSDSGRYRNHGVVFGPDGERLVFYRKNHDVPRSFDVDGVPCNIAVCSDRGYLEYSDLPGLVEESQIIIDTSGGHGGDDGGRELPWIRYRPWATRTGAYVIVSNPVHDDTDFMGRSPWGGGSAVVRPDGSIQAGRKYEKDVMIVEEIDLDRATRSEAKRRRTHPVFDRFWSLGEALLEKDRRAAPAAPPAPAVKPYVSAVRDIRIAAAQMACSRDIDVNRANIVKAIARAAAGGADIAVFPELALTGSRADDILAAKPDHLREALDAIREAARSGGIYVIVGAPQLAGETRHNCALVIGEDGKIETSYAQLAPRRDDLFAAGESTAAMWFELKGVHSIVTVGDDADWVEIGDLAASRGMYLHFHITYEADRSAETATLRKQRNLLALMYARYGAVVNAADPSGFDRPSAPAGGLSMIVSREGGHNQPAPTGLEYYLPYQTSVVWSAGSGEALFLATRRTARVNKVKRNRDGRADERWQAWIREGARLIGRDESE